MSRGLGLGSSCKVAVTSTDSSAPLGYPEPGVLSPAGPGRSREVSYVEYRAPVCGRCFLVLVVPKRGRVPADGGSQWPCVVLAGIRRRKRSHRWGLGCKDGRPGPPLFALCRLEGGVPPNPAIPAPWRSHQHALPTKLKPRSPLGECFQSRQHILLETLKYSSFRVESVLINNPRSLGRQAWHCTVSKRSSAVFVEKTRH